MRLIFMGTSEFALPALERLAGEHEVAAVFTKADKPAHRGMKVKKGVIKAWAAEHGIPVFTPSRLETFEAARCREIAPDCIVVVSYGLKIPREILDIPPLGAVNAHASILPKYRGSSPVNAAVLNGEKKSGVTVFRLNEEWDAGDILLTKEITLDERETASSLWDKLRRLSAEALSETLNSMDEITPLPQEEGKATFAVKISKEDARISWESEALEIDRYVRGYFSWPGAFTTLEGKTVKILGGRPADEEHNAAPGTILGVDPDKGIKVACGKGVFYITELQMECKRAMSFKDFLNGCPLCAGERFL